MLFPAATLIASALAACDAPAGDVDALAARGFVLLAENADQQAVVCLEAAEAIAPGDALIKRDLAVAYARLHRSEDALAMIERAIILGDTDPEAALLRAMLLETIGRRFDAIQAARAHHSAEGDLVGAALRDPTSVRRAAELAQEDTARAALAALVLAADAGERGLGGVARLLTETAEQRAGAAHAPEIQNAARELERRIQDHGRVTPAARARASFDHATNPLYRDQSKESALRLALSGEVSLTAPIGIARLDAALRADQHFVLTNRALYQQLDLTLLNVALGVELPISPSPSAALLGLRARASDAWGDQLRVHFATAIEGGPYLVLPLGSSLALEMGFYGVAVDFIDRSPSDSRISSQNRDRVGQRAAFALFFTSDIVEGRIEGSFLRDDALGDAFDALGGSLSGRLRAHVTGGLILGTGVSIIGHEFGPVGDLAIIGPAATRTELRTAVELSARIPFSKNASLVIEDVWLRNNARDAHQYTENVLSVGAEAAW